MAWNFRALGPMTGPDPFAPKRRTLPSADILRVLSWDPNRDMDHGRLRGTLHRLTSVRGIEGPTEEQRLLEWSLKVEPKHPELETYDNPARLNDWKREHRDLTQGDFEFVRTLEGVEPGKVAPEDVHLLAELEAAAQSESERRVVARVLEPIRRLHDRREEEAQLRNEITRHSPSGWRCPAVRDLWTPVLAERLAEEARAEVEPQISSASSGVREKTLAAVEEDARRAAQTKIRELWGELDGEAARKVNAARARLSELATGADPQSSATIRSDPDSAGMEEGRRRGREAREKREASADVFAAFPRVG